MSKIGPDFKRYGASHSIRFSAMTIFRLRDVLAMEAGTVIVPRSKLMAAHESPLCSSSRRTPPKAIKARRQKIRLRRVEQPPDFRWRVNLNIALLDISV